MKLSVFSDSHGRSNAMIAAIKSSSPDMIIFLGDGESDVQIIKKQFPHIPLRAVRGNCDINSAFPEIDVFSSDGVGIFMTHGHLFGVKSGSYYALSEAADKAGATLALYGHTHVASIEQIGNIRTLNPGSCGGGTPSYAEVEIQNGSFSCRIIRI